MIPEQLDVTNQWELKRKPSTVKPATQHLAEISGTNAADWVPVTTGTKLYKTGYRWYNKATGQLAKRIAP